MILADWDRAAGLRRGAGVVSMGAARASILAEAGAHIDCERFVRPSVAMVATILKRRVVSGAVGSLRTAALGGRLLVASRIIRLVLF